MNLLDLQRTHQHLKRLRARRIALHRKQVEPHEVVETHVLRPTPAPQVTPAVTVAAPNDARRPDLRRHQRHPLTTHLNQNLMNGTSHRQMRPDLPNTTGTQALLTLHQPDGQ